jgi:hypothetical protein
MQDERTYLNRMRRADAVLYLDFDGVLHSDAVYEMFGTGEPYVNQKEAPGRTLFEWTSILDRLLEPHPDFAVVLSTTWAVKMGFDRARSRLTPALQARVIGSTYHSKVHGLTLSQRIEFQRLPRGQQVLDDVARRRPKAWLAVDDDASGWETAAGHLVRCNGELGLSDPAAQRAVQEQLLAMKAQLAMQAGTPRPKPSSRRPRP